MESIQVKEFMNHYPVTFAPEMVIEEASFRLLKTKQLGGPVVDTTKKLIGYLSESDLLKNMLASSYHREHIANVADIMQCNVLSVKPYDSIVDVARQMLDDKPKIYPVVDDDGMLLGTISRNDVLQAVDRHLRVIYAAS